MRQITKEAASAFGNNREFSKSNTQVKVDERSTRLRLHGNLIAEKIGNELFIDSCGYETATTKERLNGLWGVHIIQRKGKWFLNGKEWDGNRIQVK
jgi:hypothetical protein